MVAGLSAPRGRAVGRARGDEVRAEALYVKLQAAEPADGAVARALARLRSTRRDLDAAQALEAAGRAQGEAGFRW